MNDLALIPVHELRANLTLSHGLAWWVCAVEDGADLPESLPADIVAEGKQLAALANRLMAPAPAAVTTPWLALVAGHYMAAKGALPREVTSMWATTTANIAMKGMPVGVFTQANLGEVLARCTVYGKLPTADQLIEVLAPDRDQLERRANALRLVALKKGIAG